jgi:hypothetical protein
MIVLILYFVYDDLWFAISYYPIIRHILISIVLIMCTLVAIGQARIIREFVKLTTDRLKEIVPFLK